LSPLASIISSRDIYRASLTSNSKVSDLFLEGTLVWPPDLIVRYLTLLSVTSPSMVGPCDQQEWHNRSGNIVPFLVNAVWNSIHPMAAKVDCDILPFANRRTTRNVIAKLVVAATVYFIWQERNYRFFKKVKRLENQLVECIISSVRFKLMTCRFKNSRDGLAILRQWKLSKMVLNFFLATENKGIFDSGCSRSMTGNKERLNDFQSFHGGKVRFGGGEGRIIGKGTIRTPTLDFEMSIM
nr:hypothetical protein [Tanacetum cinerariifolium]